MGESCASRDVELPAVPRAPEALAVSLPGQLVVPLAGGDRALDLSEAERRAAVRTGVAQGVEDATDVEDADAVAPDRQQGDAARWQVGHIPDDVRRALALDHGRQSS